MIRMGADAAHALQEHAAKHMQGKGPEQNVVVVAEPVSNTVLVSATAEHYKQMVKMLAALDRAPEQVVMQAMILQVPRGFAAAAGLGRVDSYGCRSTVMTDARCTNAK